MAADGTFTLTAANWSLIPRGDLGQAHGDLPTVSTIDYATLNTAADLAFSGWQITDATQISDTDKFAVVVTYSCPIASTVSVINSISVVPGSIPTRPAPQAPNEVLFECQNYYQMSYPVGIVPATLTFDGASLGYQLTSTNLADGVGIIIRLPTYLRVAPTAKVIIYNPAVANNNIRRISGTGSPNDWALCSAAQITTQGFYLVGTAPFGLGTGIGDKAAAHWTADARLGIL